MILFNNTLPIHLSGKLTNLLEITPAIDSILCIASSDDRIFAASSNAGSSGKKKHTTEIRDESGLGSGAGITSDDTTINDAGSTGPGGDRKGDKMPGEDGITSITDSIADAIDGAEDDEDKNRRRTD